MHYQWDFAFLRATCRCSGAACWSRSPTPSPASCIGLIIGLLVGLGRLSRSRLLNLPLIAYIEAFRCTPLLVQIVWFYYALPVLARHPDPRHRPPR